MRESFSGVSTIARPWMAVALCLVLAGFLAAPDARAEGASEPSDDPAADSTVAEAPGRTNAQWTERDLTVELQLVEINSRFTWRVEPVPGARARAVAVRDLWEQMVLDLAAVEVAWAARVVEELDLEISERTAVADAEGWVRLELSRAEPWRIEVAPAEGNGWRTRQADPRGQQPIPWLPVSERVARFEVDPEEGRPFRVVRSDGSPAAGAWVLATQDSPHGCMHLSRSAPRAFWTRLDGAGRGRFDLPSWYPLDLTLVSPSGELLGTTRLDRAGEDPTETVATLSAGTGQWVQVLDPQGRPAAYPIVRRLGCPSPLALGDETGQVQLPADLEGALEVLGRDQQRLRMSFPLPPTAGDPTRQVWSLQPPFEVSGTLRRASTDEPIAGAWILKEPWNHHEMGVDLESWTTTDEGGRFLLRVPDGRPVSGRIALGPVDIAHLAYGTHRVGLRSSPPERDQELAIEPHGRLGGTVLDAEGEAVAGATVYYWWPNAKGRYDAQGWAKEAAFSGRDGSFEITEVRVGERYTLEAVAPGYIPWKEELSPLEPFETREDLKIVLEASHRLTGRVVDEEGRPVAGAKISSDEVFIPSHRVGWDPPLSTTTDDDGRYELGHLPPGRDLELSVTAPDHPPAELRGVRVPTGPTEKPLDLGTLVLKTLEPGVTVIGKVVDDLADPVVDVPGVRVEGLVVDPRGAPLVDALVSSDQGTRDHTGEDGRFSVWVEGPGETHLTVYAERFFFRTVALSTGSGEVEELRIVVEPYAEVRGRVIDSMGRPLENFRVKLFGEKGAAATGPSGEFRFDQVPWGDHLLEVQHPDFLTVTTPFEASSHGPHFVDIQLQANPSISGRVGWSDDGRPLTGEQLSLRWWRDGRWLRPRYPGLALRDDGTFHIPNLRPGSYFVEVLGTEDHAAAHSERIELGSSPRTELKIQVEPGATLTGELLGITTAEHEVVHMYAQWLDWKGPDPSYVKAQVSAADRTYSIGRLGPGEWQLYIRLRDQECYRTSRVRIDPEDREVGLDLDLSGVGDEPFTCR